MKLKSNVKKSAPVKKSAKAKASKPAKSVAVAVTAKKAKSATKPLGLDANGKPVTVGCHVNHTEKPFTNGIVLQGGFEYQGEPAVAVMYPQRDEPWLNRLSKLAVIVPPTVAVH